jgi:cell division control protein 6
VSRSIIDEAIFSSSVFKNEPTLFHGYIPDQLLFREDKITTIAQNFRPLFSGSDSDSSSGLTANIAVVGTAGIGKSASVKFTVKGLVDSAKKRGLKVYGDYRNCWINRTRSAILRGLLRDKFEIPIRGFGDEEAIDVLIRRLTSEDAHLILILDEVYALKQADIESFLHLTDEFSAKHRFSVIMISRPSEWNVLISPEITQRISDVIYYNPYTHKELTNILTYRSKLAFKDNAIDDDIIELVAQLSLTTNNLRHGIEILHRAGRIADRQNKTEISPEMIRSAQVSVYPELRAEFFSDLDDNEIFCLLAISRNLLDKSLTATTLSDAFDFYKLVCDEFDAQAISQQDFKKVIKSLVSSGIIAVLDSKADSAPNRKRITIHDIPASILKERLEEQLSSRN